MDSGVNPPAAEGNKVDVFITNGQLPFSMFNEDAGGPMVRLGVVVKGFNPPALRQLEGLRVSVNCAGESWYPAIVCEVRVRTKDVSVYYVELESGLRCSDCLDAATVRFEDVHLPGR